LFPRKTSSPQKKHIHRQNLFFFLFLFFSFVRGANLNRCEMEHINEILTVTQKTSLKETIRIKCRLSSKQIDRYLKILTESGLLDAFPVFNRSAPGPKTRHRMAYQISHEGRRFTEAYGHLQQLSTPSRRTY